MLLYYTPKYHLIIPNKIELQILQSPLNSTDKLKLMNTKFLSMFSAKHNNIHKSLCSSAK